MQPPFSADASGEAAGFSRTVGIALAAYALAYPGLAGLTAHAYPATPTSGVSCPTGIDTIGMLLTLPRPAPPVVTVVPVIWAIVGGSAAIVLGMPVDYGLLASAPLPFLQRIVTRFSLPEVAG